jgi:glycosyltransferase involved in cell wall biosynthesis
MRLGLEALYVNPRNVTGIERYLSLMFEALFSVRQDIIEEILVFAQNRMEVKQWIGVDAKVVETTLDSFESTVESIGVDILHCTFIPPGRRLSCPVLYTLHDVGRYIYPELMDRNVTDEHIDRLKCLLERQGVTILTVSHSSKAEICDVLGVPSDRVHVARLFVSKRLRNFRNVDVKKARRILKKLGVSSPYILTVGCYTPTKNVSTLVRAFQKVKPAIEANLVIVGRQGWDQQCEILAQKTLGVVRITEVTDMELAVLYQNCNQYVSTSLIEGFGLPVLEAAYFGAPVACSDIRVYREILGESACYFDPNNIDEIIQCLLISTATRLAPKQDMKQFHRISMAQQLLNAYIASLKSEKVKKEIQDKEIQDRQIILNT